MSKTAVRSLLLLWVVLLAAFPAFSRAEEAKDLVQYGFLRSNALPYTADGIEILSISSVGRILTVTAANRTGQPLKAASLACVCRNDAGEIIREMRFFLHGMEPGEICCRTHTMPEGTTVTEFTGAVLYPGEAFETVPETVLRSGTVMNAVPYTSNGLTVVKIDRGPNTATLTVRNDTGASILGTSYFFYRCYDKDGVITNSGRCYVNTMKKGDQLKTVFEVERSAVTVLIGSAWVMRP